MFSSFSTYDGRKFVISNKIVNTLIVVPDQFVSLFAIQRFEVFTPVVAAEVRKKEADLLLGGLIWICKKRSKLLAAPEISVFRWLVCYLATNCSDCEVGKKRGREGRKGEGKKPLPSPSSPIPFDACHAGYELLQTVTTTKQKLNFKRVVCQSCLVHFVNSAN